jgi:hypothetical protein
MNNQDTKAQRGEVGHEWNTDGEWKLNREWTQKGLNNEATKVRSLKPGGAGIMRTEADGSGGCAGYRRLSAGCKALQTRGSVG